MCSCAGVDQCDVPLLAGGRGELLALARSKPLLLLLARANTLLSLSLCLLSASLPQLNPFLRRCSPDVCHDYALSNFKVRGGAGLTLCRVCHPLLGAPASSPQLFSFAHVCVCRCTVSWAQGTTTAITGCCLASCRSTLCSLSASGGR